MARNIILSLVDADEEAIEKKAGQVGADILRRYRDLATYLRQQASHEFSEIGCSPDLTERAARYWAYQLYTTAATELDELVADLHGDPDQGGNEAAPHPAHLIAYDVREDELLTGRHV